MPNHIEYFGGMTHGRILLENKHREELWFDRDIDGRWFVGVTGPNTADEENIGAIVVRDRSGPYLHGMYG
jgi:hypothetical protein